MKRTVLLMVAVVAMVIGAGCGSSGLIRIEAGTFNAACYGNGTCDDGLQCVLGVCADFSAQIDPCDDDNECVDGFECGYDLIYGANICAKKITSCETDIDCQEEADNLTVKAMASPSGWAVGASGSSDTPSMPGATGGSYGEGGSDVVKTGYQCRADLKICVSSALPECKNDSHCLDGFICENDRCVNNQNQFDVPQPSPVDEDDGWADPGDSGFGGFVEDSYMGSYYADEAIMDSWDSINKNEKGE